MGPVATRRFGLDDAILIKDNHITIVGGIRPAIERPGAASAISSSLKSRLTRWAQLEQALALTPDPSSDVGQ